MHSFQLIVYTRSRYGQTPNYIQVGMENDTVHQVQMRAPDYR